jgi:hypothetical protein
VSYSNPSSLLFIGVRQLCEDTLSTPGMDSRANHELPCGSRAVAATRSVRLTYGIDRPPMGPTCLCFLMVAIRWVPKSVPGVHMVWRWFGHYETWVPLGPHRPGSQSSPTGGLGLLEDTPT